MSDAKGRCVGCGFLGVRARGQTAFVEVIRHFREHGHFNDNEMRERLSSVPQCFMQECDLPIEVAEYPKQCDASEENNRQRIKSVLAINRKCDRFTPWRHGFSPKEHLKMLWHEGMLASEQKWRERQARRERKWRKEDVALVKGNRFAVLLAAVIGFAGALAATALGWLLATITNSN